MLICVCVCVYIYMNMCVSLGLDFRVEEWSLESRNIQHKRQMSPWCRTAQCNRRVRDHQPLLTVWCLVGNGGMDYGDYYWGLYRDYYRDPFPHSLLSTSRS